MTITRFAPSHPSRTITISYPAQWGYKLCVQQCVSCETYIAHDPVSPGKRAGDSYQLIGTGAVSLPPIASRAGWGERRSRSQVGGNSEMRGQATTLACAWIQEVTYTMCSSAGLEDHIFVLCVCTPLTPAVRHYPFGDTKCYTFAGSRRSYGAAWVGVGTHHGLLVSSQPSSFAPISMPNTSLACPAKVGR